MRNTQNVWQTGGSGLTAPEDAGIYLVRYRFLPVALRRALQEGVPARGRRGGARHARREPRVVR
jgi:hypothetical protein